jgi:hypothetical protein
MALAIKTAHTFSIAQLFAKLRQTHCNAHNCANLAPYIDVFTMTRRCFGVGSPCARVPPPASQYHIMEYLSHLPSPLPGPLVGHFSACQLPSRSFRAVPGTYGDGAPWDFSEEVHGTFYAVEDLRATLWCPENDKDWEI